MIRIYIAELSTLINQTFLENDLFELLQFDIEENEIVTMNEDEIRQAFQELAALFETQTDIQNSKTKKAV